MSRLTILVAACCWSLPALAQNAQIAGFVKDSTESVITKATVTVINNDTAVKRATITNDSGLYTVPALPPGKYWMTVEAQGFQTQQREGVTLETAQNARIDFTLQIGATQQTVTVREDASMINTTDGSVSTVVDRQFVENMPLNGRTFQNLIALTPGVVLTNTLTSQPGQFSINGQRTSSNYFSVDGVSANIGAGGAGTPMNNGSGLAGAQPGLAAGGGFNSLVSIDALQEFRIQTSNFAPEYGRSPGGQVELTTRSGANALHGLLFDYFRNEALDAKNWFANQNRLAKPKERQNDFGGTLGGPVMLPGYDGHDRTFFFFSYEGLRLSQPQVLIATVPSVRLRQISKLAIQPYLNAFPIPNGSEYLDSSGNLTGFAPYNASLSNLYNLDATGLRLDHRLSNSLNLFARYNYSPSAVNNRNAPAVSSPSVGSVDMQTLTLGSTQSLGPRLANDLRFNYSNFNYGSVYHPDSTGGAVPLSAEQLYLTDSNTQTATFSFIANGGIIRIQGGRQAQSIQRQINLLDGFQVSAGAHRLKFGVDYRRLAPSAGTAAVNITPIFSSPSSIIAGTADSVGISHYSQFALHYTNLSVYAQDIWHVLPHLTLTYGLRWEYNPPPSMKNGQSPLLLTGLDSINGLTDLSGLSFARLGTPLYATTYRNFAPRLGAAWQLFGRDGHNQTVLRGGTGVFYDLGSTVASRALSISYPFSASAFFSNVTLPLTATQLTIPPLPTVAGPPYPSNTAFYGFGPDFSLPYTIQWNGSIEQSLGPAESLTATYIGNSGRRLINSLYSRPTTGPFANDFLYVYQNNATSNYEALQLQFNRRLKRGLQALVSYTWAHAIDEVSDDLTNVLVRGDADFDIRHSVSAALTWQIPGTSRGVISRLTRGWSLDSLLLARSAAPLDVYTNVILANGIVQNLRLNAVPAVPQFLYGPQYPGGKRVNPAAFALPQKNAAGQYVTDGDLGRNVLRMFGLGQVDLALRRQFALTEKVQMQIKAEAFNILNHPNFASPSGSYSTSSSFGVSTATAAQGLGGTTATSQLYSVGGPRSLQLSVRLQF